MVFNNLGSLFFKISFYRDALALIETKILCVFSLKTQRLQWKAGNSSLNFTQK